MIVKRWGLYNHSWLTRERAELSLLGHGLVTKFRDLITRSYTKEPF